MSGVLRFVTALKNTDQQMVCWHTCEIKVLHALQNVHGLIKMNGKYYMVAPVGIKEAKPKKKNLFQRLFQ